MAVNKDREFFAEVHWVEILSVHTVHPIAFALFCQVHDWVGWWRRSGDSEEEVNAVVLFIVCFGMAGLEVSLSFRVACSDGEDSLSWTANLAAAFSSGLVFLLYVEEVACTPFPGVAS